LTATEDDLAAAAAVARAADAVVVIAGTTAREEGEFIPGDLTLDASQSVEGARGPIGGDRLDLGLPAHQRALIDVAIASGKPVVVVLISGSAIMVEGWHDRVGAILQTFYSGMEGGTALARLLFGAVSPSGKLPFTLARDAADYPFFDRDADRIDYGYWHGYALFDRSGRPPRYPFGHGLSYTHFGYRKIKARTDGDRINVAVTLANVGGVTATEVVQVYVGAPKGKVERPQKMLRGFARVTLAPGEERTVTIAVPFESLRWRDADTHEWRFDRGEYRLYAGGSSAQVISASLRI
jgi:beta-glucosidase